MHISKRMCRIGILLFLALIESAAAEDISGKWIVQTEETSNFEIVFKVKGNSFTGSLNNPIFGTTKIKNGIIEGDNISFYVVRILNPNQYNIVWKGKVSQDQIHFTSVNPGGELKRAIARRAPVKSSKGMDLSGHWVALVPGGRVDVNFVTNGNAVEGTVFNAQNGQGEIKSGMIEGKNISFTVVRQGEGNNEIPVRWKGKIKGNGIKFKCEKGGMPPVEFILTKAPGNPATLDLSGQWIAVVPGGLKFVLTFLVNGTVFTGKVMNSQDGEAEMKGGKIEGDTIYFYLMRRVFGEEGEVKIEWKGRVAGDEIRCASIKAGSDPVFLTLKRSSVRQPLTF
jgi:hypothetical protein